MYIENVFSPSVHLTTPEWPEECYLEAKEQRMTLKASLDGKDVSAFLLTNSFKSLIY